MDSNSSNQINGDEEHTSLIRDSPNNLSVESNGRMCSPLCDPSHPLHRYYVLVFMCFLGFGSYFCYDNPGALQDEITADMRVSTTQFSALYAWYSWPNVILCFFGGFLIDRIFGIRLGTVIFSVFTLLGQLVFALGALVDHFWLMNLGRFIFGIGGESLAVAQNTYAVRWFKDKELNMVFGLQLSFARVGSTVNFNTMVPIYNAVNKYYSGHTCLGISLFIASLTCVLSLLCALILSFYDKRAQRILNKSEGKTQIIRITDVKHFGLSFWMISLICVTYYVAIYPFTALGGTFFQRKYRMPDSEANAVDSIIYIISAALSPFVGILFDLTGRNIIWIFASTIITLASHALLCFSFINPWFAMPLMGVGLTLACALWPMVALVIPEHQLGTAYGIIQSVLNLGLGCIVLAAGALVDLKGYIVLEVFFLSCICLCLICIIILFVSDSRTGGFLNMSNKQRKERTAKIAIVEALEREKHLIYGSPSEPVSPQDLLSEDSDFQIRNRYLSKVGTQGKDEDEAEQT